MSTSSPTRTPATTHRSRTVPIAPVADRIAELLVDPEDTLRRHPQPPWWRQALASGALGIALLHVERARTGHGPWSRAETWLRYAASGPIDDGPGSHLHYGAPALAFVLNRASTTAATSTARSGRGARALATLDTRIAHATRTRLDRAHRRIDTGHGPTLAEFDAIRGLAGLGAYWLTRNPDNPLAVDIVTDITAYLVRLTEPLTGRTPRGGAFPHEGLPGWWTPLAPSGRPSAAFQNGHINNGVAHGIGGPFALLALTAIAGIPVPGHHAAFDRVRAWLDNHRRQDATGTWWPHWTTPPHASPDAAPGGRGDPGQWVEARQGRPSWCYGSPGLARAHQLAGIAQGDPALRSLGENVLAALTHDRGLLRDRLDDASLCHGHAGLLHLCTRTPYTPAAPPPARQAPTISAEPAATGPSVDTAAPIDQLHRAELHEAAVGAAEHQLRATHPTLGFLDGLAGVALALATHDGTIEPGWDRCLLIS